MRIHDHLSQLEEQLTEDEREARDPGLDKRPTQSVAEAIRQLPEAEQVGLFTRLEAFVERKSAYGREFELRRERSAQCVENAAADAEMFATMNRRHVAEVRRLLHRPPRRRLARARGAGRPAGRPSGRSRRRRGACRRSSARSGDGPDGEPEPGHGEQLLLALLARQQDHIASVVEALDEAITALAQLRAELNDERGGQ